MHILDIALHGLALQHGLALHCTAHQCKRAERSASLRTVAAATQSSESGSGSGSPVEPILHFLPDGLENGAIGGAGAGLAVWGQHRVP